MLTGSIYTVILEIFVNNTVFLLSHQYFPYFEENELHTGAKACHED
jgi:hypothetical protein